MSRRFLHTVPLLATGFEIEAELTLQAEMRGLVVRETVSRLPGTSQEIRTPTREWVCPECDYFEEDEGEAAVDSGDPSGS